MAWSDEFEEEDVVSVGNIDLGSFGSGFMGLFDKLLGGIPAQGHTKFEIAAHKLGHSQWPIRLIDKTEQGKKFNALSLLEQGKITSRNEPPFQKQILEDGTYDWDLTDPTIQAVVGGIPMRSHVNYGLDEYRASKPGFGDANLDPAQVDKKRFAWEKYLFYSKINPTLARTYLEQYNNIDTQYA